MALLFLVTGQQVYVDDEDYEAASAHRWRVWRLQPSDRRCVWTLAKRGTRKLDLFLHRLIAVRMNPEAAKRGFRVHPRDGDYFNCRRENLEVAVFKKRPGPARRPAGTQHHPARRPREVVLGDDLALLWNPNKAKPKRKKHARTASRGAGPASPQVGGDPR